MVNKMIRDTFIEIAIIIIFVIASMFMWPILSKNWKDNLTNALASENKLELILNNVGGYDNVIVSNGYKSNKEYAIMLVTEKNCDSEFISINKQVYQLMNFPKETREDEYVYIIDTNTLQASRKGYKIILNLTKKDVNYHYELEELTYF